ncbi:MAG TPA: prepilin-type N-terminal cleavage/methylation domain-containing protein [Patescibacteria group bacterium]|jgi:type II secretory pathway pseudopilin PulG
MSNRSVGIVRDAWRGQAGFTLVEVIVMMSVFTVGILGTLAVANLAVQTSVDNERRVVSANLSREGVELVRAIRDSDWAAMAEDTGPDCWDYYPNSAVTAGQPPPSSCNPRFQSLSGPTSFAAYPNLGDGLPYLVQQGTTNTKSSVYRLCQNATTGVYVPSAAACGAESRTYYRRVALQRIKNLGIDVEDGAQKWSIRVQSYVSWPGRTASDIVTEEYLMDWRKP